MNNKFDVIIIGAGPSGIFCAYELLAKKPDINILMIEKGRSIEKRMCPKRTTKKCVGCKPCSITTGFAGAGAFSDGKLSLSPDVGGHLPEILGYEKTMGLLKEADDVYLSFGADTNVYGVDKRAEIEEIRRKAINANLKLIECPIRHLGTEEGYKIYGRLQKHLEDNGCNIIFNTMVSDIIIEDNQVKGVIANGETYYSDKIVAAVGREGAEWLSHICKDHDIETQVGTVDVGVRVEVRDEVMKFLNEMSDDGIYVTARSYASQITMFSYCAGVALANANAIIVGWRIGEKRYDECYKATFKAAKLGIITAVAVAGVFVLFGKYIMHIFTDDPQIIELVVWVLCVDFVLEIGRICNIVFGSALKTAGDATYTVVIAVIFMYLFAVLGSYIFGISLKWYLIGSWIGLAMDECMRAVLMGIRWKSRKWEEKVLVK